MAGHHQQTPIQSTGEGHRDTVPIQVLPPSDGVEPDRERTRTADRVVVFEPSPSKATRVPRILSNPPPRRGPLSSDIKGTAMKEINPATLERSGLRLFHIAVIPVLLAFPVQAQDSQIDPQADAVLRAMSDYLGGQRAFSLSADASTEMLLQDGRKIQLTGTSQMTLDRDKGLHVERQGPNGTTILIHDGKFVSIFSEREGAYVSIPAEGSIDVALDEVRAKLGTELAGGADLLYSNPYDGLLLNVQSGHYMGKAWVGGVLTDHLFYRAEDIDWQLWVRSGDAPVPVKYVITSKWVTAAPQFSVQISDFTILTETAPDAFVFTPPTGARLITPDQLPEFDLLAEE